MVTTTLHLLGFRVVENVDISTILAATFQETVMRRSPILLAGGYFGTLSKFAQTNADYWDFGQYRTAYHCTIPSDISRIDGIGFSVVRVGSIVNDSFQREEIPQDGTAFSSDKMFCGTQGPVTIVIGDGRVYHSTDYSSVGGGFDVTFDTHSRYFLDDYMAELQKRGGFDTVFLRTLQRKRNDAL